MAMPPVGMITLRRAILGAAVGLLAGAAPAAAWHGWPSGAAGWVGPRWAPFPLAPVVSGGVTPAYRLYHPPGLPLSYHEPATGTTYCYSQPTGFYFVCGYSRAAGDAAEPPTAPPPGMRPPADFEAPPAPSAVLLFRLPADAQAAVDGEPVGLSGGLGAAAVAPGQHRVVIRTAGRETERTLTVTSRAVVTILPAGVSPADR